MIEQADTLANLVAARFAASGAASPDSSPALWIPRGDSFHPVSWPEFAAEVHRTVDFLAALGVGPGDRVAQLSENRYEWLLVDLALLLAGAVHVPLHAASSDEQVRCLVEHCGARLAFASTAVQGEKLPRELELGVVLYEASGETVGSHRGRLFSEALHEADPHAGEQFALENARRLTADDLATLLYTSGTTGEPKGVMLTHGNLAGNALAVVRAFGSRAEEVRLNLLPLSHIFARTCDLYTWLAAGSTLALARSRETVLADCGQVRPTMLNGVPYFFGRIRDGLRQAGKADIPGAVRALLGGRIEYCCSGGAALPDSLFDYFQSQEVPVLQGYGLSETSPVISMSTRESVRRGAVGRTLEGIDVRIAEDGEILTRGPHVMKGYWRDPQATAAALRDGWFATGDLGRIDDDGFLYITGRKKELIVLATGKNVAPTQVEGLLCEDPLIAQAMVVGDGRSCLAALLVPEPAGLARVAAEAAPGESPEQWRRNAAVRGLFAEVVSRRLAVLAHHEQVRRFVLLNAPFTPETGELTAKLSLRREVIAARYAGEIEAMYAGDRLPTG